MRYIYITLFGAAFTIFWSTEGFAELEVTKSNIPAYEIGQKLDDKAVFNIPKGGTIQLLQKPGDKLHTMTGKYTGTVGDYPKRIRSWSEWFFGSKKEKKSGGTEGATRHGTQGVKEN